MNSEYSNNPLTEVALALSMAFFSIMVLSIFALSQKEIKLKDENSLSINSSSPVKEKPKNKRSIIFYFNKNIYDKHFKKLNLQNFKNNKKGYALAVPPQISVKELFEIRNSFKKIDIKITQQNKEWNDAFKQKFIKKDLRKWD